MSSLPYGMKLHIIEVPKYIDYIFKKTYNSIVRKDYDEKVVSLRNDK